MDELANDLGVNDAEEALAHGIIDGLAYEDDFENKIKEALQIDSNEGLNEVYFGDINVKVQEYDKEIDDRIAVIYAQGPIFNTEGSAEIIGKDALNKAFDEILESKKIKAAVLR